MPLRLIVISLLFFFNTSPSWAKNYYEELQDTIKKQKIRIKVNCPTLEFDTSDFLDKNLYLNGGIGCYIQREERPSRFGIPNLKYQVADRYVFEAELGAGVNDVFSNRFGLKIANAHQIFEMGFLRNRAHQMEALTDGLKFIHKFPYSINKAKKLEKDTWVTLQSEFSFEFAPEVRFKNATLDMGGGYVGRRANGKFIFNFHKIDEGHLRLKILALSNMELDAYFFDADFVPFNFSSIKYVNRHLNRFVKDIFHGVFGGEGYGSIHTVDYVLDLNNPEVEKAYNGFMQTQFPFTKFLRKFEESGSEDLGTLPEIFDEAKSNINWMSFHLWDKGWNLDENNSDSRIKSGLDLAEDLLNEIDPFESLINQLENDDDPENDHAIYQIVQGSDIYSTDFVHDIDWRLFVFYRSERAKFLRNNRFVFSKNSMICPDRSDMVNFRFFYYPTFNIYTRRKICDIAKLCTDKFDQSIRHSGHILIETDSDFKSNMRLISTGFRKEIYDDGLDKDENKEIQNDLKNTLPKDAFEELNLDPDWQKWANANDQLLNASVFTTYFLKPTFLFLARNRILREIRADKSAFLKENGWTEKQIFSLYIVKKLIDYIRFDYIPEMKGRALGVLRMTPAYEGGAMQLAQYLTSNQFESTQQYEKLILSCTAKRLKLNRISGYAQQNEFLKTGCKHLANYINIADTIADGLMMATTTGDVAIQNESHQRAIAKMLLLKDDRLFQELGLSFIVSKLLPEQKVNEVLYFNIIWKDSYLTNNEYRSFTFGTLDKRDKAIFDHIVSLESRIIRNDITDLGEFIYKDKKLLDSKSAWENVNRSPDCPQPLQATGYGY